MGKDKGLLSYHGKPQREYLFELLQGVCSSVYTSCRKDQEIPQEFNPLIDRFGIPGPMTGIMSAFTQMPGTSWLIVAVDMPYVNKLTLDLLLAKRNRNKIATCFYSPVIKGPEPLLTLWEARAHPLLCEFTKEGNTSPQNFLRTHDVNVNLIRVPHPRVLANLNSHGEETRRLINKRKPVA